MFQYSVFEIQEQNNHNTVIPDTYGLNYSENKLLIAGDPPDRVTFILTFICIWKSIASSVRTISFVWSALSSEQANTLKHFAAKKSDVKLIKELILFLNFFRWSNTTEWMLI